MAAIIAVIGAILIAVVSGMLVWMFAIVRRIERLDGRVTGVGQQLREVPKRRTDRENNGRNDS